MTTPSAAPLSPIADLRLGELFCGPGGLALGALRASVSNSSLRIKHTWAVDYDADTCQTYRNNIAPSSDIASVSESAEVRGRASVICGDVRQLNIPSLSAIDIFAFGAPCSDWSAIGERRGLEGSFGPLYSYGAQVLRTHRALAFVFENVTGIKSSDGGRAFVRVLNEMRESGYDLRTHTYKFERYGIPQARHRVIVVGIRDDLDADYRIPSEDDYATVDVSARTALSVPPIPVDAAHHDMPRHSAEVVERLRLIKPGQNAWTADLPERLRIKTRTAISSMYRRLHPDHPAYTVTASGGGGYSMYHYDQPRALTSRERARLQTFPDDYVFVGGSQSVRKQIGMAVPPKAAEVIFTSVLEALDGRG